MRTGTPDRRFQYDRRTAGPHRTDEQNGRSTPGEAAPRCRSSVPLGGGASESDPLAIPSSPLDERRTTRQKERDSKLDAAISLA